MRKEEWSVDGCLLCAPLYLPLRLSLVSVVFEFNTLLNDVAPVSWILLTISFVVKSFNWVSFVFITVLTVHAESGNWCIEQKCFTEWFCSSFFNPVVFFFQKNSLWKRIVFRHHLLACCLLRSLFKQSSVSAVFNVSALLNAVAPLSSIRLPVVLICAEAWLVEGYSLFECLQFVFTTQVEFCYCCVWFQWFTQWCCSCVSYLTDY